MSLYFTHAFEGPIDRFGVGKSRVVMYQVLFLPEDLAATLPFDAHPRLRVDGEIADVPVNGAFIPTGDGRRYFIVAPRVFKDAGIAVGDLVEMRFRIDDQNRVDMPDALTDALAGQPDLSRLFEALTPGKKRALAHHVATAKTDPTTQKRVQEALDALAHHRGALRRPRKA